MTLIPLPRETVAVTTSRQSPRSSPKHSPRQSSHQGPQTLSTPGERFEMTVNESGDIEAAHFTDVVLEPADFKGHSAIKDEDSVVSLDELYPESSPSAKKRKTRICCCTVDPDHVCCGTTPRTKLIIILSFLLIFSIGLVFFAFAIVPIPNMKKQGPPLTSNAATTTGTIKVLLLGDSVLGIPSRHNGLEKKIAALLPQYYMDIVVSGKLGVRMFVLRERLDKILAAEKADVIILYSDSDLSNVNEDVMSIQEKLITRNFYRANFTSIVESIQKTNAKLALSGPGLLGEGPFKQIPNPARFVNKDGMLDDYCTIARGVAAQYNVPYLDIRGTLKANIPWYRLWYAGYITKDGEHTNERGTLLLADLISRQLLHWFEGYNSSTYFRHYNNATSNHFTFELDDTTL